MWAGVGLVCRGLMCDRRISEIVMEQITSKTKQRTRRLGPLFLSLLLRSSSSAIILELNRQFHKKLHAVS